MPLKKAKGGKPIKLRGKLGKALEKIKEQPRKEEDEDDILFEDPDEVVDVADSVKQEVKEVVKDIPAPVVETPKPEPPKPEAPKPEPPKAKVKATDIEKLIRKALVEELARLEEGKKATKEQKSKERENKKAEFLAKKAAEKAEREANASQRR